MRFTNFTKFLITMFVIGMVTAYMCNSKADNHLQDLYLIYDNTSGLHKIGKSNNVDRRLNEIERNIGRELTICKIFNDYGYAESMIHDMFESKNVTVKHIDGSYGHEWYDLSKDDVKTLKTSIRGL